MIVKQLIKTKIMSSPKGLSTSMQQFIDDPVKLIIIPITSKKSFVYFKHSLNMINKENVFIRNEIKISIKFAQLWSNVDKSDKPLNKKIVRLINSLLDKTHWFENSLKTIPSKLHILKLVAMPNDIKKLTYNEYLSSSENLVLKPIHIYYPDNIIPRSLLTNHLNQLIEQGKYHKKHLWYNLAGIPFTLPLAVIPIVPNIPGFYLAYRAYSNWKAYLGSNHLQDILTNSLQQINFVNLEPYSCLFQKKTDTVSETEEMIVDQELLNQILDKLEIHEIKMDLEKAIRQERKRLICD